MGFSRSEWMADLDVRHRKQMGGGNWKNVENLKKRISATMGLPCWCYRWLLDTDNPSLIIGSGFGIGYSTCGGVKKETREPESPACADPAERRASQP